jgi:hypothetical protein
MSKLLQNIDVLKFGRLYLSFFFDSIVYLRLYLNYTKIYSLFRILQKNWYFQWLESQQTQWVQWKDILKYLMLWKAISLH